MNVKWMTLTVIVSTVFLITAFAAITDGATTNDRFEASGIEYVVTGPDTVMATGADETITELNMVSKVTYEGTEYTVTSVSMKYSPIEIIHLPDTASEVSLSRLEKLAYIVTSPTNPYFSSNAGALLSNDGTELVYYPRNCQTTDYTVPGTVTKIADYAFTASNVKSVYFSDNVASFGYGVLSDCNDLEHVRLPSGMTSLPDAMFTGCFSLTSIDIPSGVKTIGEHSFSRTYLESLNLPSGLTEIGDWAFADCRFMTSIAIPNSVTHIGVEAFAGCEMLTSLTMGEVDDIGEGAFDLGNVNYYSTCIVDGVPFGYLDAFEDSYTHFVYTSSNIVSITVNNGFYGTVSKSFLNIEPGVTWTSEGNRLTFSDGQTVAATAKDPTDKQTYTFIGFEPASGTVSDNTEIDAIFGLEGEGYTIEYRANGGSNPPGTQKVSYGERVTLNDGSNMTNGDYYFKGWLDQNGRLWNPGSVIQFYNYGNLVLVAQWSDEGCTVHIAVMDFDGEIWGSVSHKEVTVPMGTTFTSTDDTLTFSNGVTVTLSMNTEDDGYWHYECQGWTPSSGTVSTDLEIWGHIGRSTGLTFPVEYYSNGGVGETHKDSISAGRDLTLWDGSGFSKEGAALIGWSVEPNGPVDYQLSETIEDYPFDRGLFLYAVWSDSGITVSVTINDRSMGSISTSILTVPSGTTWTVTGDTLVFSNGTKIVATPAEGYSVMGWTPSSGTVIEDVQITVEFGIPDAGESSMTLIMVAVVILAIAAIVVIAAIRRRG